MAEMWGKKLAPWVEKGKELCRQIESLLVGALRNAFRKRPQGLNRRRGLSAVNAVAMSALKSSTLEEFLEYSLRETVRAAGMEAGMIYLKEESDERLVMVCQEGLPENVVEELKEGRAGDGLFRKVFSAATPYAVSDLQASGDPGAERWANCGYSSFIATPIPCGEEVLGVMALLHREKRAVDRLDSDVLNRVASVSGAAIGKFRRYEELGKALVNVRRMNRLDWETLSAQTMDQVLDELACKVCEAALALSSMISLTDEEGRVVRRASCGFTRRALASTAGMDAVSAHVLRTGECRVICGREEAKELLGTDALKEELASAVCLPLMAGDRPLGSLWVNYESPRRFALWELEQLRRIADRVAAATENARLRFAFEKQIARYKELQEQYAKIGSRSELRAVLQAMADSARELLGARVAAAYFSSEGISGRAISTLPRPASPGIEGATGSEATEVRALSALFESDEAPGIKEIFDGLKSAAPPRNRIQTGGFLAVPLLDERNEPAGLLMVGNGVSPMGPGDETERLLDAISRQGMIAIRNAVHYERTRRSIEQYQALLDRVGVALVIVNKDQIISLVNRAFENLTGYAREDLEGKVPLCDILPEMEREEGGVVRAVQTGCASSQEEREISLRAKDRQEKKVKVSISAIENSGRVVLCLSSLPGMRRAEEADSRELRLPPTQGMSASVLAGLDQAVISAIDSLDALLQRQWPLDAKDSLEAATAEIRECRETLQAIQVLTEPRPLDKKAVDINGLITDVVEERRKGLQRDTIGVVLRLDADLPTVEADADQLRWTLGALMEHFRREMRETDEVGALTVQTERLGKIGRVTISGTSPHAPSDRLERLLDHPQAGEGSPKEANWSLLACRAIVERHGWRISVESLADEGVAFTIKLPLPEKEAPASQPEANATVVPASPQEERKETIARGALIVSGEEAVLDFLEYYLRSQGHAVEACRDGREARRKLKEGDYDLVFCDVEARAFGGQELFQWLLTNKPDMERRVVFLVGDTITADTLAFLEETGRRWLQRPFDLTDLRETIGEILAQPPE